MKKHVLAIALCALGSSASLTASAQSSPGYLNSAEGVVRSGTGLCWHTGSWTPANAIAGCDTVAVASVPPVVPPEVRPVVSDVLPVAQKAELDASVHFAFDRSDLSAQGKAVIDDVAAKVMGEGGRVTVATVTGYADRFGAAGYNHGLAKRRAESVAARLAERGVAMSSIEVREEGQSHPIVSCPGALSGSTIACLAPNRRAEIVIMIDRPATR